MVFVGLVCDPVEFYVVIDDIKLKVDSALVTLDTTFEIFLNTRCSFPKLASHACLLLKKVIYGTTSSGKSSIQSQKAISSFKRKLNKLLN